MTFNILFNLDGEEPKQHPQDVKNDLKKLLVGRARRKLDETGKRSYLHFNSRHKNIWLGTSSEEEEKEGSPKKF